MKKITRALIVDDERLARKEMMNMLAGFENIEVIGEADSTESAKKLVDKLKPDLIFLDIQMPGESGFSLAEEVKSPVKIIFVTAYDEFAVRAFEINALDYLMKPVNPERLRKAIEKLDDKKDNKIRFRKLEYEDTIFIMFNSQMKFIKLPEIISIESSGDYSEVYLKNGVKGLTSKPMREWEERLPSNFFIRIHRTSILNLNYVQKIEEWFNNSYKVYMLGKEEPLIMSRRFAVKLKDKMG